MDAERRSTLRRIGLVVGVGAFAAPLVVNAVHPAALASARFASIADALKTLEQLRAEAPRMSGAWDLPHVLHHTAQSIEYSINGFVVNSFLDEVAKAAGKDPIEYQLSLLTAGRKVEGEGASKDYPLEVDRLRRVIEVVRDRSGWKKTDLGAGRGRGPADRLGGT